MPEIIRTRPTRYRDDYYRNESSSDEDGYVRLPRETQGYQTMTRYRVARSPSPDRASYRNRSPDRGDQMMVSREVVRERDVGRDRPRSYVDYGDRDYERVEREREAVYQVERQRRSPSLDRERERVHQRTVVYERDEPRRERDRPWDRPPAEWEHEQQVTIVKRRERTPSPQYEMVTRETEYYEPAPQPQPLVIRQRAPEPQRIYVEAPAPPAPIVVREPQTQYIERIREVEVERPRQERNQEIVYKRHEIRGSSDPEDDLYMEKRYVKRDGDWPDGEYRDDYIYRRQGRERRRDRSRTRSESPNTKRNLALGAGAGLAAGAILANHRSKSARNMGRSPEGRGSKAGQLVGGAALGALGAAAANRIERRRRSRSRTVSPIRGRRARTRSRSRSSSPGLGKKEKLGIAGALLAGALIGGKMLKDRRDDRRAEEMRGRSRTRSRSRISLRGASPDHRHMDPKHRKNSVARNAAVGAAALAAVNKIREHRSKSRGEPVRSKSKRRTGAELVAAGLTAAVGTELYERRKAKQEAKEEEMGIPPRSRSISRSRSRGRGVSRSRSRARSVYSDRGRDPYQTGMVEYGDGPVVREKSRSRSRAREAIAGAAAATAAAVGVKKFRDRRERRREEEEMERGRERAYTPSPDRYYDRYSSSDGYSPSPPRASGGAYYPHPNDPVANPNVPPGTAVPFPPPPVPPPGTYTQQTTTTSTGPVPQAAPYDPAAYPPAGMSGGNPNYYDDRRGGDHI